MFSFWDFYLILRGLEQKIHMYISARLMPWSIDFKFKLIDVWNIDIWRPANSSSIAIDGTN